MDAAITLGLPGGMGDPEMLKRAFNPDTPGSGVFNQTSGKAEAAGPSPLLNVFAWMMQQSILAYVQIKLGYAAYVTSFFTLLTKIKSAYDYMFKQNYWYQILTALNRAEKKNTRCYAGPIIAPGPKGLEAFRQELVAIKRVNPIVTGMMTVEELKIEANRRKALQKTNNYFEHRKEWSMPTQMARGLYFRATIPPVRLYDTDYNAVNLKHVKSGKGLASLLNPTPTSYHMPVILEDTRCCGLLSVVDDNDSELF